MAAGLGLLRLSPSAFWGMTLRELQSAVGVFGPNRASAPGRDELAELMNAFPDVPDRRR